MLKDRNSKIVLKDVTAKSMSTFRRDIIGVADFNTGSKLIELIR